MRLRQSIEGDVLITLEDVSSTSCWLDGDVNYIPGGLSLMYNGQEYIINEITGYSAGFLTFPLPEGLFLKGGDIISVISNCDEEATVNQTVIDINFTGTAPTDITSCSDSPVVTVGYDDIIRLFLQAGEEEYFSLNLNGDDLTVDDFHNQPDYTGTVTSPAGEFTPDESDNVVMFSNNHYPINNTININVITEDTYFTVRLGFIELIFDNGTLRLSNYATGVFSIAIGTYNTGSSVSISSTGTLYSVYDTGGVIYTASKTITLLTGVNSGSITPSLVSVGGNATWNFLRTYEGVQTLTASLGNNIRMQFSMNVTSCNVEPENQTHNAELGDTNNPINPLTYTGNPDCVVSGFRIVSIGDCITLKINGVVATVNTVYAWVNRSSLTYDISSDCGSHPDPGYVDVEYDLITSTPGCFSSTDATIRINLTNCPEDWVPTGISRCNDCQYQVEEIDLNAACSGSEGVRWVDTEGGECLQEIWEDTGETRCEDCVNQKEQRQTNECLDIPNRWVAGGNACNYEPVWEVQDDNFCADCIEYGYRKDVNPCSPTYNQIQVFVNENGTACNYEPLWTETNRSKCINFVEHYEVRDINPCSPTYQKLDYIINPDQNRCAEDCDDVLFISEVCDDQCAENERTLRAIPQEVPCDIKLLQPQISGDRVVLHVENAYGEVEYSNDGFSWQSHPIFYITAPGKIKYYARRASDTLCMTEITAYLPDTNDPDPPYIPSFPPVYECTGGNEYVRYENTRGEIRWEPTGNRCDVCQPEWVTITTTDPICQNGYYQLYQEDGCGNTRLLPTNQLCNTENCISVWVDKIPYTTICIAGYRHKYIVDGCGNEQTVSTGELCGDCLTPDFTLLKTLPTCGVSDVGQSNIDGRITIQNIRDADRYQWSTGITFNGDTSYNNALTFSPNNSVINLPVFGFNPGEASKFFSVRMWNRNSNCFLDKSIEVVNPCIPAACVYPTYAGINVQQATCSPIGQPLNNAGIGIQGIQNATHYGYSEGSTYYGQSCGTALPIIGGQIAIQGLTGSNSNLTHRIRLYNGCENPSCFTEFSVVVPGITCTPPITCKTYQVQSTTNPIIVQVNNCNGEYESYEMEPGYRIRVCATGTDQITVTGTGHTITEISEGCIECTPGGLTIGYSAECAENALDNNDSITFNVQSYDNSQVRLLVIVEGVVKYDAIHNSGQNYRYIIPSGDAAKDHLIEGERADNLKCGVIALVNMDAICACASNPTGEVSYTCPPSGPVAVTVTPTIFGGNLARIIIRDSSDNEVYNNTSASGVGITTNLNNGETYTVRVEDDEDDSCGQTQTVSIACSTNCSGFDILGINNITCSSSIGSSADIAIGGAVYPITVSVKKQGDPTERFIQRVNDTIYFQHDNTGLEFFTVTVTDNRGCVASYPISVDCSTVNITPSWLTWGQAGKICDSNGNRSDWTIIMSGLQNAQRYKICYGQTSFICGGNCLDSDGSIDISSSNDAYIPINLQSASSVATIRFYADDTCTYYADLTVTLPAEPGPCCNDYDPVFDWISLSCNGNTTASISVTGQRPGNVISVRRSGDPSVERFISLVGNVITFSTANSPGVNTYNFKFTSGNCEVTKPIAIQCYNNTVNCPAKDTPSNTWMSWYKPSGSPSYSTFDAVKAAACANSGSTLNVFVQGGASMDVGSSVWLTNNNTTCTDTVPDGYYYRLTGNPAAPFTIILITSGKIFSKTYSACEAEGCDSANYDVIFLIDESGSISNSNWNLIVGGVNNMIDGMAQGLDNGNINAAIVMFGSPTTGSGSGAVCTRIRRMLTSDRTSLKTGMSTTVQAKGSTPMAQGLFECHNLAFSRPVPKKIVVITDGLPNLSMNCAYLGEPLAKQDAEVTADNIRSLPYLGIYPFTIITVGIALTTSANNWLRNEIANSPSDHFTAATFEDFVSIAETITETICS